MFSAVPTPQVTASVLKALELIKTKPEIRKKLWDNTSYLRKELTERGFDIVRDNKKVYQIAKMLQERGIFTIAIVYLAVRTKEARLRAFLYYSKRGVLPYYL